MSFLFDIIIIGIIVFSIYRGISQGFVKSLMKLISIVVALVATYLFCDTLAEIYMDTFFFDSFAEKVAETVTPVIQRSGELFDLETLFADMPEAFADLLQRFGVSAESLASSFGGFDSASAQTVESMSEAIATPIASVLSKALAFITIFVGTLIIMAILTALIDLIFKLPILKKANKFLGFLLGVAFALLYAYLFSEVAVLLIKAGIAIKPEIFNENIIDNSILLKYFSDFSLVSIIPVEHAIK